MKPGINIKKLSIAAGLSVSVLLVLLYLVFPVIMGVIALMPSKNMPGSAPAGYEEISFFTDDNVQIQAWYLAPQTNGAVILLLHGAGSSRESMRSYAEMLAGHGYGLLMIDLRGHGLSAGKTNRLGWQGTRDIGAALRFLESRPEVKAIGALGNSMGGEVLLGSASRYPVIRAIVAEGATRRSSEELLALPGERPLVRSFTARLMYAVVDLLSGEQPPEPLLDSIKNTTGTRFLLIAAGTNPLEVSFNQLYKETLGDRAILWVAAGAEHTAAFASHHTEYEQRVVDFFNQTIIAQFPLAIKE